MNSFVKLSPSTSVALGITEQLPMLGNCVTFANMGWLTVWQSSCKSSVLTTACELGPVRYLYRPTILLGRDRSVLAFLHHVQIVALTEALVSLVGSTWSYRARINLPIEA